jgi:hypothetical protein
MSTTKKLTRPIKPKTTTVTSPAAEPTVVAAAEPVVESETTTAPAPVKSKRQQTSKSLKYNISSARVRRHLDKMNINRSIDTMVSEMKTKLADYQTAKSALETGKVTESHVDADKTVVETSRDVTPEEREKFSATVAELESQVPTLTLKAGALTRERTRFSNEASIALSIVCNELINQLAAHTMDRVLASKKKIIQVSHLHESGVEKLSLYPLVKSLPSFVREASKLADEAQKRTFEATLAAKLAQAEKDFRKKYAVVLKKKKAVPAPEQAPVAVEGAVAEPEVIDESEPEPCESADSKTSFRFYVGQACKDLKESDARYAGIRISTDIRSYLSDLLVEFMQRLSTLVHLTASSMKNKTVNEAAVMRTVEMLLVDGHSPVETIQFSDVTVADPAALKVEQTKKEEEKAAGRSYKIDLESLPKVPDMVAVRAVTYPGSGFDELKSKVDEKLRLYKALGVDA